METRSGNVKREPLIDILKALGIISIVVGHSCEVITRLGFKIGPFVYTYHIMVFMFVAGFCFKKEHATNLYGYIGRRLKSVLPVYLGYNLLFILLHNVFLDWHMIPGDQETYNLSKILMNLVSSLTFVSSECLLGAFWFLPMYLYAVIIFCGLFRWAEKSRHAEVMHVVFVAVSAFLGLYMNHSLLFLNYHIQTSILCIPIIYFGYFVKCHWNLIRRYVVWWAALGCAGMIYWILSLDIGIIELSVNWILSPWLFYPVTILGIYFCTGIAQAISRCPAVSSLFICVGQNSYHIMALHFLAFKILDAVYGRMIHVEESILEKFPHSFDLWILYWLAGVLIPLGVITGLRHLKKLDVKKRTK